MSECDKIPMQIDIQTQSNTLDSMLQFNCKSHSKTLSIPEETDINIPNQKFIYKVTKKRVGDTKIISVTPQKSVNRFEKQYDIRTYDCDSRSSSMSSTRQPVSISINSATKLKPLVEHVENIKEFLDVYKRVVSRNSVGNQNSVESLKTGTENERKNGNEAKGTTRSKIFGEQNVKHSFTFVGSKSSFDENETSSLLMKSTYKKGNKRGEKLTSENVSIRKPAIKSIEDQSDKGSIGDTSSNLLMGNPERKLLNQFSRNYVVQSRSNLSIIKPETKSLRGRTDKNFIKKNRSNDSIKNYEKKSLEHKFIEKSIPHAKPLDSELPRLWERSDESQKVEVRDFVEPIKIFSSTLLKSKPREEQISPFEQAVSAPIKGSQREITGSSDTSLTALSSDIYRSSISSRKFSQGDDSKYLLPHLEKVEDDSIVTRSIMELTEIVETRKQKFQKKYSADEDAIGSFREVPSVSSHIQEVVPEVFRRSISSSSNQDADKGVDLKEETELAVYEPREVLKDSIQPSLVEELPISPSSKKENKGSISDQMDDPEASSSILDNHDHNGFNYKYKGGYDDHNLRTNFGCLKWLLNGRRKYCGYFQYNSLHGEGYYFIKRDGCLNFYDGKFFNNKLHGYGQIIYNNGDKFEGLFRENTHFGPGIWSHEDNTQDVGIWYGNSIIRLNVLNSECIPVLGRSSTGKLKLIEHKKIIPLDSTHKDRAYSIMQDLNADEDPKKRFKELYNPHVRNRNSIFFNQSQYDQAYFDQEDCNIDVINTNFNLSDFIVLKKGKNIEILKEKNMMEIAHIEEMTNELNRLKKKIKSYRSQSDYDSDGPDTELNFSVQDDTFYKNMLEFLDFKLKKCRDVDGPDYATKKILIDSILAWNNCDTLIDVLKHCFVCRKSENNVSFNVRDVLTGKRSHFGTAGPHEKSCIKFLDTCMSCDIIGALQLLANENINPNVCDSKGNTGLHLATWGHDTKMIGMLANHGANLDSVNDEGISPLNLCLLRYLESVHEVINWESSFLCLERLTIDQEFLTDWRPHDSFWNLLQMQLNMDDHSMTSRKTMTSKKSTKKNTSSKSTGTPHSTSDRRSTYPDRFIFSLKYVSMPQRFAMELKTEINPSEIKNCVSVGDYSGDSTKSMLNRMEQEVGTIKCLLHYGADPNKEGVPHSSFFMALFSKSPEIVKCFLAAKADPNMNLYGMTPLQVIACLELCDENCKIMQILLDSSSNTNALSDPSIWQQCDKHLLGDFEPDCEIQPRGKDVLHFICLREDFTDTNNYFLCQMAEKLISSKLKTRSLYLGHSHLTMAIIKGNVALVECLSNYLDLKRPLGFGLGNALTVLALTRYQNILPFFICKKIIDLIIFEKISPFEPLYHYCNIFEFLDVDSPPDLADNRKVRKQYISYVKSIRAYFKSHSQENANKKPNELTKVYIQEKSRKILDIINRFKAVFYLYCFIREGCLDQNTNYLAKLIGNSEESLTYIRYIFNRGKMPRAYFSLIYVAKMMIYVDNVNNIWKRIEVNSNEISDHSFEYHNMSISADALDKIGVPSEKGAARLDYPSLPNSKPQHGGSIFRNYNLDDYMKQLDCFSFEECDDAGCEDIHKWVTEEYLINCNVCYFCMHRRNKTLLRCPDCGIVKFCSKRCNYLSIELKNVHPCPSLFYQNVYNEYRVLIENESPLPIYGIDLVFDNLRKGHKAISIRKNSGINCVKSEDGTIRSCSSKSVKSSLNGGANTAKEKAIFLSQYIMEPNSDHATENKNFLFVKTKNNIEDIPTKLNEETENDIDKKLSSTKQQSVSTKMTKRQEVSKIIDEEYNNLNVEDEKDSHLQTVCQISDSLCRNVTRKDRIISGLGLVENCTSLGDKCIDDAKMCSSLPYIETIINMNLKQKTDMENGLFSKDVEFPTIQQFKGSTNSIKNKTTSNILAEIRNEPKYRRIS